MFFVVFLGLLNSECTGTEGKHRPIGTLRIVGADVAFVRRGRFSGPSGVVLRGSACLFLASEYEVTTSGRATDHLRTLLTYIDRLVSRKRVGKSYIS